MFQLLLLALGFALASAHSHSNTNLPLAVHPILRYPGIRFENLAIRPNGHILTTSTGPNASVYLVDPAGKLPFTLIHTIPNVTTTTGIVEKESDVYYVVSGDVSLTDPQATTPSSYLITEIDMRNVYLQSSGKFGKQPSIKTIANLPGASLLNGAVFAHSKSDHLLVADSWRGLIWNVNVKTGAVGVTLNDTSTKGPGTSGPSITGVNGVQMHNDMLHYTNTGRSTMYKVKITSDGSVASGSTPQVVTTDLSCDDFTFDRQGNAYVAGPLDILTRVSPKGEKLVLTGTFNSTGSSLVGPTAVKFGRGKAEKRKWRLYVTTNGGISPNVPGEEGVSRVDLGHAW